MSEKVKIPNSGQRDFLFADVWDNSITKGIRGRLTNRDIQRMIAEYDEEDKQARVHGKFHHLVGLIFKNFNRKIHVIRPFQISKRDYVVMEALDPHPRNPDAVMWVATDKNGTKFIVNELYANFKTGELAHRVKLKAEPYRLTKRLGDPSMFVEDQHEENPLKQSLSNRLKFLELDYIKGTKNRRAADRRVKDALDYEMVGSDIIVAPEIYIFDTCVRTIYEIEHYQWDDWRGKAAERKSPMEKPMDKDDHMIENLGRILVQEPVWTSMPKENTAFGGVKKNKDFDPYE